MTVEAYAKVNLTLEVYGRRPDGYHALRSLVAPISLADTLDVELTDDGTFTSDTGFPDDLCLRAARRLMAACVTTAPSPSTCANDGEGAVVTQCPGVRIRVTKRIPVGGGLGGGSADAAATLRALNELCHLGLTPERLAEIGADVGSDVPALVLAQHYRQAVLMEGRGEKVSLFDGPVSQSNDPNNLALPQSSNPNNRTIFLVLANPGVSVSTAEAYRLCVPRTAPATVWVNDLQTPAVKLHPEIADALALLRAAGVAGAMMSGSGSSVFGFVRDEDEARRISAELTAHGCRSWPVRAGSL